MADEDVPVGNYDDSNRAFLQSLLAHGTVTFEQAKHILAAIFSVQNPDELIRPNDVSMDDFESYMGAAADALSPFDYEIRSTCHQISKERIWAVVNTTSDPMTQIATVRSTEEIAYIKRLLDMMFETYNSQRAEVMAVTSLQAMKVAKAPSRRDADAGDPQAAQDKGLTQQQAEMLLKNLAQEGWLEKSKAHYYSLSVRALLELRSWLGNTYNYDEPDGADEWQRIKYCAACKDIVTIGQRCAEVDCNMRLHDICAAAYWRTHARDESGSRMCTKCGTEWTGKNFVGERAVTTTEAYLKGRRISKGNRRNQVVEEVEEDADGDDDDADE